MKILSTIARRRDHGLCENPDCVEQTQAENLQLQSGNYWPLLPGLLYCSDKNVFRKLFPLTFQPMLDYVDTKERQGVFFEKPTEKIHLPEPAELALMDHSKSEFRQSLNFI